MDSKIDRKTGKLDFRITIPEDERGKLTMTRERFLELLNDDLKSGGYEITEVDNDFIGGGIPNYKNASWRVFDYTWKETCPHPKYKGEGGSKKVK